MMKPSVSAFSPYSTVFTVRVSMSVEASTTSGSLSMKAMQLFLPYSSMRNGLLNCDRKMLRLIRPMGRSPSTTGRLARSRWRVKTSSTFSLVSSAVMQGTGVHRSAALGGRKRGRESLR